LPAIFTATPTHAKPTLADPKNASDGKKNHRPKADISIGNREVHPPTHWSLSFRQKKIHFIPPLAPYGIPPWRSTADGTDSADQAGRTRCNAGICNVLGRSSRAPFLQPSQTAILPPLISANSVPAGARKSREEDLFCRSAKKIDPKKMSFFKRPVSVDYQKAAGI
jgi:hypothetical protein